MTEAASLFDIIFYFFAGVTIISAAVVVFSKNIIYSAFSLLFTFFGVAGIYVLLNADFLAVTQLLIYVGGILVLMLFGVMLTNKVIDVEMKVEVLHPLTGSVVVAVAGAMVCAALYITDWPVVRTTSEIPTTANALGEMMLTSYLLPFEIASVVLLVALVGAAMIARRDPGRLNLDT